MASTRRRPIASLKELLLQAPHRFEFFQAVRILERIYRGRAQRLPIGRDAEPRREVVRFRSVPSFTFPKTAIVGFQDTAAAGSTQGNVALPLEMQVAFMGLAGVSGVLAEHYTELVMQRVRQRDYALRDFLDLLTHRNVSFFYRAWEKYRLPMLWERGAVSAGGAEDLFTQCLRSFIGLGTAHLPGRLAVSDDTLLFFAGHFARRPRSAVALKQMLSDYLHLPVEILQFQGRWLFLDPELQTRLPGRACPQGQYPRLGMGAVAGDRAWDVRSKFRIRIGPVSYDEFLTLMPGGSLLTRICHLTRAYVGPELVFDVQAVLQAEQVPRCQLRAAEGLRLGWNSWLVDKPCVRDAEDAAFKCDTSLDLR
jgi:type VI secretion system protein ImpH